MKASIQNSYLYNKDLKELARKLRNNSTKSEIHLWGEGLSKRKRSGYVFLRQRPVLNFIADFMCKELLLIIEVDGITHTYKKDKIKDKALKKAGFEVLRFTDELVINDLDLVIQRIDAAMKEREKILGLRHHL